MNGGSKIKQWPPLPGPLLRRRRGRRPGRFMVPMRNPQILKLSMNRASADVAEPLTPALSPSDGEREREKTTLRRFMVTMRISGMLRLSMNRAVADWRNPVGVEDFSTL